MQAVVVSNVNDVHPEVDVRRRLSVRQQKLKVTVSSVTIKLTEMTKTKIETKQLKK